MKIISIELGLQSTKILDHTGAPLCVLPSIMAIAANHRARFKATSQTFTYFFAAAKAAPEKDELHVALSSDPELPEAEKNRAIACAKVAGAVSAVFASSESVIVTDVDHERLHGLLQRVQVFDSSLLSEELTRATIVPQKAVPPTVVTMNSVVRFLDHASQKERELTLVYPEAADVQQGKVSILAPVGTALLGLRLGQSITWPMPRGQAKRMEVLSIPFQPEAAGRWDL